MSNKKGRKARKDMTPAELMAELQRQQEKVAQQLREVAARETCRLLVEAFVKADGEPTAEDLQEALESAQMVCPEEEVRAQLESAEEALQEETEDAPEPTQTSEPTNGDSNTVSA